MHPILWLLLYSLHSTCRFGDMQSTLEFHTNYQFKIFGVITISSTHRILVNLIIV